MECHFPYLIRRQLLRRRKRKEVILWGKAQSLSSETGIWGGGKWKHKVPLCQDSDRWCHSPRVMRQVAFLGTADSHKEPPCFVARPSVCPKWWLICTSHLCGEWPQPGKTTVCLVLDETGIFRLSGLLHPIKAKLDKLGPNGQRSYHLCHLLGLFFGNFLRRYVDKRHGVLRFLSADLT